ncbi:MAG: hypothetical protein K6360_01435 [Deltaproteobacteria bacterium]
MLEGVTSATTQKTEAPKFVDPAERGTLDRDDFMKLFVTQLQYQDPMEPMESAEMASQMAQFNMVDLMHKNNKAMETLVTAYQAQSRLGSLSLLGREVQYKGTDILVDKSGPRSFYLEAKTPSVSTKVTILDASGTTVRSLDIGPLGEGRQPLEWDGLDDSGSPVPAGMYTVRIDAKDGLGEPIEVTTWTSGIVEGIAYSDKNEPLLSIAGGPEISIYDIWKVNDTE